MVLNFYFIVIQSCIIVSTSPLGFALVLTGPSYDLARPSLQLAVAIAMHEIFKNVCMHFTICMLIYTYVALKLFMYAHACIIKAVHAVLPYL